MVDLHQRLEFATKLAYQAGDIMLKHFQIGKEKEIKSDNSPVTVADREVNRMVIEAIAKEYPNDGVLGEEESNLKENAPFLWVCDPIDGTRPFAFGIPTNMFALALVKDGVPIVGVIYDPYMKRLYSAKQGEGTVLNNERIQVSGDKTVVNNFVGLPVIPTPLIDSGSLLAYTIKQNINGCSFLSITYVSMLVVSGQIPGACFAYTTAHDIAAVKIIVEEAGGKVTDLLGNEQRYDKPINGAIISNGLVHDELVALVKPYLTISA